MSADPLMLLPGLMCDARVFAPQIEEFASRLPVMVWPTTQGDRIEEIASDILTGAPPRFALLGHSMGGIVAMEVIRRAPSRVTRACLISTSPLAETPEQAAAREPRMVAARAGRLDDALREDAAGYGFAPGPDRMTVQARLLEMGLSLGADIYRRQSRALQRRRDQQATLKTIRAPTMVICGVHDRITPVRRHEFMAEMIPYAQLRVIEAAGHLPTLEAPGAVSDALHDWMHQPLVLR